jgi:hypothetical protein
VDMMENKTFDNSDLYIKNVKNKDNKNWYECNIYPNGGKYYRNKDGRYHRLDGPAIIYPSGKSLFYVNGHNVTFWFVDRGIDILNMTDEDWMIFNTEMRMMK